MITLRYSSLKKIAYLIMALPFMAFSIGWLKWYWAVPVIFALVISVYYGGFRKNRKSCRAENTEKTEEKEIRISKIVLIIAVLLSIIWVWLSGIGGLWGQSSDFAFRNAIYRDLVLRDWPVVYPVTGHALVYYIGFWLIPSLFGKTALILGASENVSFDIAKGALFVWTAFIVCVVFLLIIYTINAETEKKQLFIMAFFVLFSGIDVIGNIGSSLEVIDYHLEWWAWPYQYSSFTTCLFWVYNQALPAWICFLCLLNEKNVKYYVFLGMMCLFNAPLPFVGWFIYCIYFAVKKGIEKLREKKGRVFVRQIFSGSNVLCILFLFPIIATYLLSNQAIHGSGSIGFTETIQEDEVVTERQVDITTENTSISKNDKTEAIYDIGLYVSFIMMEFGFYMIMICMKYKKNILFYITIISLLLIPLFKLGHGQDFVMRVSLPGIIMVFLFVGKFLIEERYVLKKKKSLERTAYISLSFLLLLGAITPGIEFFRGTKQVIDFGIGSPVYDNIYTLGCDGPYDDKIITYGNFVAVDLENQTFFKVFCKKKSYSD